MVATVTIWLNKSLLKYHGVAYYVPVRTRGLGFTGKVNDLLAKAWLDTSKTDTFNIYQLNKFYRRIKFRYLLDTSTYMPLVQDICIDSILPKDQEESYFLQNSYLRITLRKQQTLHNQEYFHIRFDRRNKFIIKEITIDSSLYKTRLS